MKLSVVCLHVKVPVHDDVFWIIPEEEVYPVDKSAGGVEILEGIQ